MDLRTIHITPPDHITPIPPTGSIDAHTANLLTDPKGPSLAVPLVPGAQIINVGPTPVNVPTVDPPPAGTSTVQTGDITAGGLMAWVNANPLPAAAIAAAAVYLLYKWMK